MQIRLGNIIVRIQLDEIKLIKMFTAIECVTRNGGDVRFSVSS